VGQLFYLQIAISNTILDFWTPTDYLSPACVFTPKSSLQISVAILTLTAFNAPFAVRGGGHMPIPGYANTDGGVLIGLTNLNQSQLSKDKSIVSVGPGLRWEQVYEYLEPYGLVTLGGRVGLVGVPGLLLGGGISFYSNQHGFAADNVVAFEVCCESLFCPNTDVSRLYSQVERSLQLHRPRTRIYFGL
jgi:FAD/FMN-containing dehydrogenase